MAGAAPSPRERRGSILIANASVVSVEQHDGAQCVMRVQCPPLAERALPGSFVHLRCADHLAMRRPMSVMRVSARDGWLDMLFKIHGIGTALLAERKPGDVISMVGPIGQPFRLTGYRKRPLLIGGGVGIPPMLFLAEHMRATRAPVTPLVLMGSEVPFPFRARPSRIMIDGLPSTVIAAMPLLDDWGIASRLASQAGFAGTYTGFVTDLARYYLDHAVAVRDEIEIYACGPTPMLRAVAALAHDYSLPAQISLEEYMACAVGGCAGCTVKVETPTGLAMKRVCVDGPVFEASQVVFPA